MLSSSFSVQNRREPYVQNTKQLIFNGAEGYKPARGCTVTLVFGNPVLSSGRRRLPIENDEVRMTRSIRLTASDNVVIQLLARWRRIFSEIFHRLLNAANARPDGYNIVLQGDVTGLARMTPIERERCSMVLQASHPTMMKFARPRNKRRVSIPTLNALACSRKSSKHDSKSSNKNAKWL